MNNWTERRIEGRRTSQENAAGNLEKNCFRFWILNFEKAICRNGTIIITMKTKTPTHYGSEQADAETSYHSRLNELGSESVVRANKRANKGPSDPVLLDFWSF